MKALLFCYIILHYTMRVCRRIRLSECCGRRRRFKRMKRDSYKFAPPAGAAGASAAAPRLSVTPAITAPIHCCYDCFRSRRPFVNYFPLAFDTIRGFHSRKRVRVGISSHLVSSQGSCFSARRQSDVLQISVGAKRLTRGHIPPYWILAKQIT